MFDKNIKTRVKDLEQGKMAVSTGFDILEAIGFRIDRENNRYMPVYLAKPVIEQLNDLVARLSKLEQFLGVEYHNYTEKKETHVNEYRQKAAPKRKVATKKSK